MGFIQQLVHHLADYFMAYGVWGLMFVSFADSSFFPVPPDFLLIPLAITQPQFALFYGTLTAATSVMGAVFGWWIGLKAGRPILYRFFKASKIIKVEQYFHRYGGAAIAVGGFTPLPYKIFTIVAGMSNISLTDLLIWSILSRGARFMIETFIIMYLGETATFFIAHYFGTITVIIVIVVIAIYVAYRLLRK